MNKKAVITVSQLFVMLFISRVVTSLTYNPSTSGRAENILDHVISGIISFFLMFLMVLPCYFLHKQGPRTNLVEKAVSLMGKWGAIFALIYILYYFLVCCHTLSMFNTFMSNVIDPKVSLWVVSFAVIIVSCYGAKKGIEGLARTSFVVMLMMAAGIIFLICALMPKVDALNYTPMLYEGTGSMIHGVVMLLAQSFCIPALAMLLPLAKGDVKKGIFFWSFVAHALFIIIILLMVGSLGEYLKTQMFPIYAAASIAEVGALKRLDSIYLGLWTSGMFCKISLFLFLISLAFRSVWGKTVGKVALFVAAALIAVLSTFISSNNYIQSYFLNINLLFYFTVFTSMILPLLLLFTNKLKKGGKNNET